MTPANPDALADALARELARLDGWQDPDALWTDNLGIIARGGEGSPVYLDYVEDAGKLIAGPLAPLLADLQQQAASISSLEESVNSLEADLQRVTAELDAAREGAYDLKLAAAGGEDIPGSASLVTANDVRHWREKETRALRNAEARAAQLQAEVEAMKAERTSLRADANVLGAKLGSTSIYDDPKWLRDLCWEAGNFLARRIVSPDRTELAARAATAREGQTHTPASGALKIEEADRG